MTKLFEIAWSAFGGFPHKEPTGGRPLFIISTISIPGQFQYPYSLSIGGLSHPWRVSRISLRLRSGQAKEAYLVWTYNPTLQTRYWHKPSHTNSSLVAGGSFTRDQFRSQLFGGASPTLQTTMLSLAYFSSKYQRFLIENSCNIAAIPAKAGIYKLSAKR